jgi:predicted DNA-binding transcriptional regulator YafY
MASAGNNKFHDLSLGKEQIQVRIRFDREVARYVQETTWHPSQQLKAQKDGSILASFVLNSTTEIKSWVLSFGSHAVVLEPAELRAEIVKEFSNLIQAYDIQSQRT